MTCRAFTLAEVLITLAVISVVAAMTIPTLIQNHQEKVTVTKLKKFYSVISQAYQMAEQEYGTPDEWDLIKSASPVGANNLLEKFAGYMKMTRKCNAGEAGCWENMSYHLIGSSAILADGSCVNFQVIDPDCAESRGPAPGKLSQSVCGAIATDINCDKAPNLNGKDSFQFYLTKYGIIPTEARRNPFIPSLTPVLIMAITTTTVAQHG